MAQNPSDSQVQRDIEKELLAEYENQHPYWKKVDLSNLPFGKELAKIVKPDAVWKDEDGVLIIAECYVRIGKLKPGHRRKIATDILKLITLKDEFGKLSPSRLFLFVPEEIGSQLEGNDWLSLVISKKIELVKVSLTDEQRLKLQNAIILQGEGQSRMKTDSVTDDPR
jgi:hypothetical protein